MAKAVVDQDTCIGCEVQVGVCPATAISMNDGKAKVNDDMCGACVSTCLINAISQLYTNTTHPAALTKEGRFLI